MERIAVVLAGWGLVLSARGAGEWLLRRFRIDEPGRLPRALQATGLGLGAIALATLALGTCGAVRFTPLTCVPGLLLALRPVRDDLREAFRASRGFRWASWNGAMLASMLVIIPAIQLLSFLSPWDYDVLEYHLGAPAQYLRQGRIAFLPWNMYASFPENAEMLFTCLLSLFPSRIEGAMAGAAMNVAVSVLCALAVADLASTTLGARAAVPAAAIFYSYPLTWIVSHKCYVEILQVYFSVLCVRALLAEARGSALAGVFAGLAMGTKYPAALFLAMPIALFLLARGRLRTCIVFGVAATLALSPWLARNLQATGNPVYPLLGSVIPTRGWTAEKEARFSHGHHPPQPPLEDVKHDLQVAITGLHPFVDFPKTSILIVLAPLLILLPREGAMPRATPVLVGLSVLHIAAWWFLTNRIDRFFYPAVPWLALLAAQGLSAIPKGLLAAMMRAIAVAAVWFNAIWGAPMLVANEVSEWTIGSGAPWDFLLTVGNDSFPAIRWMNENLQKDTRVMLLGEAQTFYMEKDFVAATVFDDCPLDTVLRQGSLRGREAREAFHAAGITHVLVNWNEVMRLRRTWSFPFRGRDRPGYSDAVCPEVLHELESDALEVIERFHALDAPQGSEPVVLYRVREP